MRKVLFLLTLLFLCGVVFPTKINAHGGVQKLGGSTVVTIRQTPLSPLVGEKVKFTFVVSDPNFIPDRNLRVTLSLWKIEIVEGKAKEIKILERPYLTSANGAFDFEYTFAEEKEFYLAFEFEGRKGGDFHYVIKPRMITKEMLGIKDRVPEIFIAFGLGCGLTFLVMSRRVRKKKK